MTTYDWHTTYRTAVEAFNGATPGAELEQHLLEEFQHSPQTVQGAIDKAASSFAAGKITSPWGIVRSELNRISAQPHLTIVDGTARERAITRAEAWIRHTGLRLDQDELETHLFAPQHQTADLAFLEQHEIDTRGNIGRPLYEGLLKAAIQRTREHGPEPIPSTGGPLTEYETPALRQRMITLWTDQQDRRTELEAEELESAQAWKRQQANIGTLKAQALAELDAKQLAPEDPPADLWDDTTPNPDLPF